MAHNLNFYQKFISKIGKSFKNNNFNELLEEYIDKDKISHIRKIAGL